MAGTRRDPGPALEPAAAGSLCMAPRSPDPDAPPRDFLVTDRRPAALAAPGVVAAVAPDRRSSGLAGIPYFIGAGVLFIALDTVAKHLSATYPVPMIVWARYLGHLLVCVLLMAWTAESRAQFRSARPLSQALRSACLLGSTFFFFLALSTIPLADATTLIFATPMLVLAASHFMLGERVGPRRWLAVAVGMIGVVIVLRPGFGFQWAYVLVLASCLFYAAYQIMTRTLTASEPTMTTFFHTALVATALACLWVPFYWKTPDLVAVLLMALTGLFGGVGHLLVIKALTKSEASLISPFAYANILWATLAGYLVFGALPDEYTLLGAAIIIGAGLYIVHRERVVRRRQAQIR
jgi:drug/metabolite transporter (DMT)-like permease